MIKPAKDTTQNLVAAKLVGRLKRCTVIEIFSVVINRLTAKAMEGMDSDAVGICPNDTAQTLTHRGCSAVGKGKTENILRQHICLAQDVGGAHAE